MTHSQFNKVFRLASEQDFIAVTPREMTPLEGCALPGFNYKVAVTREVAASFLRWHALQLDGKWHLEKVEEMRKIFKRKVLLIG
jgi:hypothetical protein